jgi:3'(2'), 5'-bisphosphate nucleotidase
MTDPRTLLDPICALALTAGRDVFSLWGGCVAETKTDGSPVTIADARAEKIILDGLKAIAPDIPAISEEASSAGIQPKCGATFFLVDPIDGTRDFLEGGAGEFTVNIGLVVAGAPVLGVVYAPALGQLYAGCVGGGVFRQACERKTATPDGPRQAIAVRQSRPGGFGVVKSRRSDMLEKFLSHVGAAEKRAISSSLKFCLVAAGEADLYPRFGPVSEWDACAGDAVLRAAGGAVMRLDGAVLTYQGRKDAMEIPGFIACGDTTSQTAARKALALTMQPVIATD